MLFNHNTDITRGQFDQCARRVQTHGLDKLNDQIFLELFTPHIVEQAYCTGWRNRLTGFTRVANHVVGCGNTSDSG